MKLSPSFYLLLALFVVSSCRQKPGLITDKPLVQATQSRYYAAFDINCLCPSERIYADNPKPPFVEIVEGKGNDSLVVFHPGMGSFAYQYLNDSTLYREVFHLDRKEGAHTVISYFLPGKEIMYDFEGSKGNYQRLRLYSITDLASSELLFPLVDTLIVFPKNQPLQIKLGGFHLVTRFHLFKGQILYASKGSFSSEEDEQWKFECSDLNSLDQFWFVFFLQNRTANCSDELIRDFSLQNAP